MHSLAKLCQVALLSGLAALGTARDANAAYVVINADPAYGAQFPGLSWRAVGALYIPDFCLAAVTALNTPPGIAINPFVANLGEIWPLCSQSRIQDVQLQFYDSSTGAVVDTLGIGTYTPDRPPANFNRDQLIQELIGFTFLDGQLDGFGTTLSRPMRSTSASAYQSPSNNAGDKCFALELSSLTARVESFNYNSTTGQCVPVINTRPAVDATNPLTQPTVTFNRSAFISDPVYRAPGFTTAPVLVNGVPEPTSLALVALALVAAGATARRRKA